MSYELWKRFGARFLVSAFCLLPSAFCSQSGGSGRTIGCAGGMPAPCAATDRAPRPNLPTLPANGDGAWTDNGPPIGLPWVNEFGEREVRATDGNVPGGLFIGDGWIGPVGWWFNYFSVFDASFGGYYFYVPLDSGEGNRLFKLNAKTMQVKPVCSTWANCAMPYAGEWSFVTPGLMYYGSGSQACSYNYDTMSGAGTCTDGVGTLVYDFGTCPSLSGITGLGDLVAAKDDQTFSERTSTILAIYSVRYAKCYWVNVSTSQIGGTDNPTPVAATLPSWPSGYGYHDAQINASGQYGWLVPDNGGTLNLFWQAYGATGIETTTVNACAATSGACLGHISFSSNIAVYVASNPSTGGALSPHYDFATVPLAAPTTETALLPAPQNPGYSPFSPSVCNVTDTHTQWLNSNISDSAPSVFSSFVDGSTSFALMQINCAWDHEVDVLSTGGGTVWRLAHNRATGQQNPLAAPDSSYNALSMPVCSSDGRYCMFATDWQAALGTQTGEISSGNYCRGAAGCAWAPSTAYAHYQEVIDSNGNEEMATVAGTSGSGSHPTWPTTAGGTVTDGGVTWQMGPGCNTPATTATNGTCRTDLFIVEVH